MAEHATKEPEKPWEINFSFLIGKLRLREEEELAESHTTAELRLELGLRFPAIAVL